MSPRRWNVCPDCDGTKKGSNGDVCYVCQGLGGSWYGEDRTLEAIDEHIRKTIEIRDQDRAEMKRARLEIVHARPENIGGYQKQIGMLEDSLRYWDSQLEGLEIERNAAIKRGPSDVPSK